MASKQRRIITRNRELLACTECRRRKLKCNRNDPCTNCSRRDDAASCKYQRSADGLERERERRMQAESRLEHLEQLVQQLAQKGDGPLIDGSIEAQRVAARPQTTNTEPRAPSSKAPIFNGPSHWSAMLEDIEGLRSAILPNEATANDDKILEHEETNGTNLILNSAMPLPLQQVLAQYLPPRQETDRLIAAYFRSGGVSAPFIHASHFRRLYQDFWREPLQTPVLWTSILFSVCHIAENTLILGKDFDNRYSVASAHCLALGEYFRPKQFSVESLLLFLQEQCLTGLGISSDSALMFGSLVRLATIMGFHRDPELSQFSAFESEMRRRTWSLCMQLDLLISFQLGLPSNVQFPTWDTRAPRNLQNTDFDEHTVALPPARPDSELTDVLFYIAKHKLMAVFEKILRHTLSTAPKDSTDVNELDAEMRSTYSSFPEILHPRPIADSIVDSPSLIVTRLCVFFLYQKCLCVLHRPYVTQGHAYSVQVCRDTASNIVRYFRDTYEEFLPGGQLEAERWFMGNITWHDYLLGVTALCLVLCAGVQSFCALDVHSRSDDILLLQRAQDICVEKSARSKDSGRVRKVVKATLQYFGGLGTCENEDAMDRSVPIDPSNYPGMQSPFTGDQADIDSLSLPDCLQKLPHEQTGGDWARNDSLMNSMDDASWA